MPRRPVPDSRTTATAAVPSQLVTAVGELDSALQKGTIPPPPPCSPPYHAAYGKALAAQTAIGELPYGSVELEQTAAFLAKAADIPSALPGSLARIEVRCGRNVRRCGDCRQRQESCTLHCRRWRASFMPAPSEAEDLAAAPPLPRHGRWDGDRRFGLQDVEANYKATLVYDGPFSEHLTNRTSKCWKVCPGGARLLGTGGRGKF